MIDKEKSLTHFIKTGATLNEPRDSCPEFSHHTDVAINPTPIEWLWNFFADIKHFALYISKDLRSIFSYYISAIQNQPPKEWLWHFLRDAKYFAIGIPAIHDPKMELKYGTWQGAFFCRDEDGRLLGENTAVLNHPSIDWKERRFSDSRGLAKINDTALRQMSRNWRQLISDIGYLRNAYARVFSIDSPLNFADLYYLSRIGTSMPSFFVRRKENPISALRVPVRFAAIFKVLAGVQGLIITMIAQHQLSKEELHQVPSSLDIFEFGDKGGQFITPTGHACAGSRAMILELLEVMIHGKYDIDHDCFSELMDDLDPIIQYGICCGRVDILMHWNNLINHLVRKEGEPRHVNENVSKDRPHHIVEAFTLDREQVSEDLEKVSACLRALEHHSQTRGVKCQIDPFSCWDFNVEGDLNGVDFYLKRQDEVVQVFDRSMNEINEHLGRETSTAVYPEDIYQRKCNHFTEQVLKYRPPSVPFKNFKSRSSTFFHRDHHSSTKPKQDSRRTRPIQCPKE
ncbi:MAG: hypothetical protein ACR2PG_11145 [Hyphomicrobiaceae bacterium]